MWLDLETSVVRSPPLPPSAKKEWWVTAGYFPDFLRSKSLHTALNTAYSPGGKKYYSSMQHHTKCMHLIDNKDQELRRRVNQKSTAVRHYV